ncbi:hypothetical protein GCM10027059_45220 [Myceligenerans halotolerans]
MMENLVEDRDATILGARWLQWAASMGVSRHPIADQSGRDAGRKQPNDVWFVAGTFGGHAQREFSLPAGRRLFLPAFCMWSTGPLDPANFGRAFGSVDLDGRAVELTPAGTAAVRMRGSLANPVTGFQLWSKRYVFGLWALVPPFAPGQHQLAVRGGDGYGFETEVDAVIHVV